jgi:hypothetical protein
MLLDKSAMAVSLSGWPQTLALVAERASYSWMDASIPSLAVLATMLRSNALTEVFWVTSSGHEWPSPQALQSVQLMPT